MSKTLKRIGWYVISLLTDETTRFEVVNDQELSLRLGPDGNPSLTLVFGPSAVKETFQELYRLRAEAEDADCYCGRCGAFGDKHNSWCRVPEEEANTIMLAGKA